MNVEQAIAKVAPVVRYALDLSVGVKLLIGSAVGALGGSTFIGFISEYATYNFAFSHGVRLPVEGVPYLRVAATLLSLAVLAVALLCFGLTYWFLRQLLATTARYARMLPWVEEDDLPLEALPLRRFLVVGLPAVFIVTFSLLAPLLGEYFEGRLRRIPLWSLPLVCFALSLVVAVFVWKPKGVKWFVIGLSLLLVVGISISLFNPRLYGQFLRRTRFGGGIEVTIYRNCEDLPGCRNQETGYLFLRTKEAAIVYRGSRYLEIPVNQIRSYEYKPIPRWNLPQLLPGS